MKYSVIIPIYNAAATIGRCLDSLLGQPHEDAEILLINDGSTDESGEICRRYAQAHGCVCYFEKENGGVSSARNLGLEKATGEYILFVDSDDYVTADYFAVIDEAMERWDPDMLLFGLKCFGERSDVWQTGSFSVEGQENVAKQVRRAMHAYLFSNLMTKTFRAGIIRDSRLRFDESLSIGEDQAFAFAYAMHIRTMCSIERVLYLYSRESGESLSCRRREYLAVQLLQVTDSMRWALEQASCSDAVVKLYEDAISWAHYRGVYSVCKELRKSSLISSDRRKQIGQICEVFWDAGIVPVGIRTKLIAVPVKFRMCYLLDFISNHSRFRKRLAH